LLYPGFTLFYHRLYSGYSQLIPGPRVPLFQGQRQDIVPNDDAKHKMW